ncbi:beta-ketoacyl synthase [Chromobacterium vaccinii]|uniref:beta-ketoacyl synthase n=1 Tax=Chromobacterium vaccinii TaxID=1108595 RepID=UPI003C768F50
MKQAPLIVAAGGINAAGRTSGHRGYQRLVFPHLSAGDVDATMQDLAVRMGLGALWRSDAAAARRQVLDGTLVRDASGERPWLAGRPVRSAALLPRGFDPGALYPSRNHPAGIRMTVYAMADALASLGLSWDSVCRLVGPDRVAVYAGSSIGQIDAFSMTSLVQQAMAGKRVSTKLLPLSFPEMPADFINGYILHSIGRTGASLGACASFLYNLRQGVEDIQSGRAQVAIIGGAEAPIEPPVLDGFAAMGALATTDKLPLGDDGQPDYRRACQPFGRSAGFVLGESAQVLILMADELALALGANVMGMVADVFVQADGAKKSITEPGIGNHISMLKAAALARSLLDGRGSLYVHAHGTGTPLNCATEAAILKSVAEMLGTARLAVTSIKPFVGHSLGTAAGDQIAAALGAWRHGWVPGITTIDQVAESAAGTSLDVLTEAREIGAAEAVIVNAKGFGGNNASAVLLGPEPTLARLAARYGEAALAAYRHRLEGTLHRIADADDNACQGKEIVRYQPGGGVDHDGGRVRVEADGLHVDGYLHPIALPDGEALRAYFGGRR